MLQITRSACVALLAFCFQVCLAHTVAAHEFTYSVTIQCEAKTQTAKISADHDDDQTNLAVKAHVYDFDHLPKIACDFGSHKKVLISSGRNDEHPNDDAVFLEINKPSRYVGFSILMQFGGYIIVQFDNDNGVHIQNCAIHPMDRGKSTCEECAYKTKYNAISGGGLPSFDCTKASTVEEVLICDDPKLSAADLELSRLYHQQLEISGPRKDKLMTMQKAWQHVRGAGCFVCYNHELFPADTNHAKACLLNAYEKRIEALKSGHGDQPMR